MDKNKKLLTEGDFMRNEAAELSRFAHLISEAMGHFGIDGKYIARQCNIDPRLVWRAKRCIRIHVDCERRIRYFIKTLENETRRDTGPVRPY